MKKIALFISIVFLFTFECDAAFDRAFIDLAISLEDKYPELFKGFKDTDFESLETLQNEKIIYDDAYLQTPSKMYGALVERIKKHAGADPEQAKLLREMEAHQANNNLNYIDFIAAMLRHQALLRLKAGAPCEFEKITTELGDGFGEKLFSALTSGKFSNLYKSFTVLDDLYDDDSFFTSGVMRDYDDQKKEGTLQHVAFPLYGHHEVGIVYLAYMFLNKAFPIAYPDEQGDGRLHGMTMSVYAEFVHDALHMQGFTNIDGASESADKMLEAYANFLKEEREKADAIARTLEELETAAQDVRHYTLHAIVRNSYNDRKDKEEAIELFLDKVITTYGRAAVQKMADDLIKYYRSHAELVETYEKKPAALNASDQEKLEALRKELIQVESYRTLADKLMKKLDKLTPPSADDDNGASVAASATTAATVGGEQAKKKKRTKKVVAPLDFVPPRLIVTALVNTLEEKEEIQRNMVNQIFLNATQFFSTDKMSEARYKTLMIGFFNRLHEDYFDGKAVLEADTVEDVLNAFFKLRGRNISLKADDEKGEETDSKAMGNTEDEFIPRNNPFEMDVLTGDSALTDDEILERALRMPSEFFVDERFDSYATFVGGSVIRRPHVIGIKLFTEDGAVYKMRIQTPKTTWRLNAEHDTSLVNMGCGDVEGLLPLTVPELGADREAANKLSRDYLESVATAMDKIYARACMLSARQLDIDATDAVNKALKGIEEKLQMIFPQESHKMVFAKEEKK